ncbi:uncharacterized protein LOC144864969 isoform X2 [Branchiostoma floridae x Branchiostoma japonicum]
MVRREEQPKCAHNLSRKAAHLTYAVSLGPSMMPASSDNQVQHSTNGGDTRELAGAFDWALETGERLGRQEESWRTLHARSVSKSGEPCTEGLYSRSDQQCGAASMIGFGQQVSSGNPQTFVRPPNQPSVPPTHSARPPNPVEYLPHIAAAQHRFLPPPGTGPLMYPGNIHAQSGPRPPIQPAFLPHPYPIPAYPVQVLPPNIRPNVQVSGANQQYPAQVPGPPVSLNCSIADSHSAMEPRFPTKSVRTRPLRHRPMTYQPFVLPMHSAQHPPPSRYPPPIQQFPPTSAPPPASYHPQSYPNTPPYTERDSANEQSGSNWGADWEVTELKKSLYREFATLLSSHGPLGERDQPVLGLFMGMPTEARQLIKECGGVKAFLLQSPKFSEEGGKIFLSDEPRTHVAVSSADSGQGSWESNAISSRPTCTSGINPNAMEFVPSECSFSEASSDDVFVEGETYESEQPDSESAFKEIATAYGIRVTRPEAYSLEDCSLEGVSDGSLPEALPKTGPCVLAGAGDAVQSEEIEGAEHTFESSWAVVWDEQKMSEFSHSTSNAGSSHWSTASEQLDSSVTMPTDYEDKEDFKGTAAGELVGVENSELVEEITVTTNDDAKSQNADFAVQLDNKGKQDSVKGSGVVVESDLGESCIVEDEVGECSNSVENHEAMAYDDTISKMCKDADEMLQVFDRSSSLCSDSYTYTIAKGENISDQVTSNGTISFPKAEGNANIPETLTQTENGVNDAETTVSEDTLCSCGTAVGFPTFHEETATVEQSLDTFFHDMQLNKDRNNDAQEHDESCGQENFNENNNNVDKQFSTDEIADCDTNENAEMGHVEKSLIKERLCQAEMTNYNLHQELNQTKEELNSNFSKMRDSEKALGDMEEECKNLEKLIQEKEERYQELQQYTIKMEDRVKKVEEDLSEIMEVSLTRAQEVEKTVQAALGDKKQIRQLEEKVTDLQEELETAKKALKTKESTTEASPLQLVAVEKALTEKLQQTEKWLWNYGKEIPEELKDDKEQVKDIQMTVQAAIVDQNQIHHLQEKVMSGLREELETAKKELKAKVYAAETAHLQLAAVEKELTEKLQQSEAQLQSSLQHNCSQDAPEELKKVQERATQAKLQLAAVEKELTERLQLTEAHLKQHCSQSVLEDEKQIHPLQEILFTVLEEKLETAKEEEMYQLQHAAVVKELIEKLQLTQAELQKSLQQFCSQDGANGKQIHQLQEEVAALQTELETAKKEELSSLQHAAVEKNLIEKLKIAQEKLQKSLQQNCSQFVLEDQQQIRQLQEVLTTVLEEELESAKDKEMSLKNLKSREKVIIEKLELAQAQLQKSLEKDVADEKQIRQLQERVTCHQKMLEISKIHQIEQSQAIARRENLIEKIKLGQAQLQKSLQHNCSQDMSDEKQTLQEKVTALQEELETAKRELKTKEAAAEKAQLQHAAVEKELTDRLQSTEAKLQYSMQQYCSKDVPEDEQEMHQLQEKVTTLQEQLETAKKETKGSATKVSPLQLEAVEKELTEKLQHVGAQLEKSLQMVKTVKKELKTKESAAEKARLQHAAVEKELTERLQHAEAQLQESLQNNCSLDELKKAKERATQAELKLGKMLGEKLTLAGSHLQQNLSQCGPEELKEFMELAQVLQQRQKENEMTLIAGLEKEIELQKKLITNLQQGLETAQEEGKTKEAAAKMTRLQLEAVEKALTEKLQNTEAQLQDCLQLNCSRDEINKIQEEIEKNGKKLTAIREEQDADKKELKTAKSDAEKARLQLAAVEKALTKKLQQTQAQLQKSLKQNCSQDASKEKQKLQKKITALQEELETTKKELKTKESAVEKADLQLTAVEKELTERLRQSEAELQKSLQQNCNQDVADEKHTLKEKVTALQEELENAKKELAANKSAAEKAHLQHTAVEKELTEKLEHTATQLQNLNQKVPEELRKAQEKLKLTEEQLQKALQQSLSRDELKKAQVRATQAELQLATVEKELTEKLRLAEAQKVSENVVEELVKAQKRATQAEIQVLNSTFRWCRSELEEQYREGERMYRFFTERCMLGERELEKFSCDWQDYTSDILKQITQVQLLYSTNVQRLQSGQPLSSLPQLSLVRPQMPRLPDLTANMLSPPDSYKLHLVPLCPIANQSVSRPASPPLPMPTGNVDWSSCIPPPKPLQEDNSTPDGTSSQEAGNENHSLKSDQHSSLPSNSKDSSTENSNSSTQEDSASQGKRSPENDVQPPPKARVSEDKKRLRLPSGMSKAAAIPSGAVPVSKRRTRTESGSSCSSNVTEASVASVAGSSGPPGLVNLQEPMMPHSTSPAKSVSLSPAEKSQLAPKTGVELPKPSTGNEDSLHPETGQSASSQSQGDQSTSMVQGAARQPSCPTQTNPGPGYQNVAGLAQSGPGYQNVTGLAQSGPGYQNVTGFAQSGPGYQNVTSLAQSSAGYMAPHPMGLMPPGYAGQQAFSVPRQVPLGDGLQFMPDIHKFSSTPPGVFEFAGHHLTPPNVLPRDQGAHPQVQPGAKDTAETPDSSLQPNKEQLKAPASISTKTSDNQKTASFTQAVRPKSTIPTDKARAMAQQALTEDALDTRNKYQALDTGIEDATEEVDEAAPAAKGVAEHGGSDETRRKAASPVSQLSNVQQLSKFPEIEDSNNNNNEDEWQMQLSKKKRKVLAAVKESEAPQTSGKAAAKQKLLDRLQADLPGYSREQLLNAAAAVRRARHGTLSSLPFCIISGMVKAELYKSQLPAQVETSNQPSSLTPPSSQVQTAPSSQPGTQANNLVQATPSKQPGSPASDQAAKAPLSTEAQCTGTTQSFEASSSANQVIEATEGNLQLARSLLQLKYKTEMCSNFRSSGTCRFGDKCLYAHGERELRRTPKLTPCPAMQQKGHCPHGDSCIFAHSKNDLKAPARTPEQVNPVAAVRRTSPTARMRLVDLKKKKEQTEDRLDKKRPLWQTVETKQRSQSLEADVCAICVDDLYDLMGSCVRTLDCGHRFHDSCVSRWLLKEERTCPCCRQLALLPEEFPRLK